MFAARLAPRVPAEGDTVVPVPLLAAMLAGMLITAMRTWVESGMAVKIEEVNRSYVVAAEAALRAGLRPVGMTGRQRGPCNFAPGRGIVGACARSPAGSSPCSRRSPSGLVALPQRPADAAPAPTVASAGPSASGPWRRTRSCGRVTARPPCAPCSARSTTWGVGPVVVDGFYGPQTKAAVKEITDGFEGTGVPTPLPDQQRLLGPALRPPAAGQQPRRSARTVPTVKVLQRALRAAGATSWSTATSAPRPRRS